MYAQKHGILFSQGFSRGSLFPELSVKRAENLGLVREQEEEKPNVNRASGGCHETDLCLCGFQPRYTAAYAEVAEKLGEELVARNLELVYGGSNMERIHLACMLMRG